MAEYGLPYMGSKGSICNELIRIFPKAENFYDLFGGGFSVTHAMLERRSRDYKHFHFNEIRPGICDLVRDAIAGKYSYENFKPPFVSREEFFDQIDKDPMIKMLWSFGNNGRNYLFSKEIEPYKRSMHNAIVFNEFDDLAKKTLGMERFKDDYTVKEKRFFLRNRVEFFRKTKVPEFLWPYLNEDDLKIVKQQEKPDELERLQRLQKLQKLEQISFYSTSYDKVPIEENSIIYCDPPYQGTAEYDSEFDHKKFFDWCDAQENPVFVSEYNIQDKRFSLVFKINKRSMLSPTSAREDKLEKVYANRAGIKKLNEASAR